MLDLERQPHDAQGQDPLIAWIRRPSDSWMPLFKVVCAGEINLEHARRTDHLEVDLSLISGAQDTLSVERESKNRWRRIRNLSPRPRQPHRHRSKAEGHADTLTDCFWNRLVPTPSRERHLALARSKCWACWLGTSCTPHDIWTSHGSR